ncbi:unnamed protein product [Protopolystoma xenopodis]|uniref:Uncharacterized protein n=1 Tax=Protopolystoma xenopodis TaxID=117903 RepID=A0A3S5CVD1_9PLAT|nr:unnamed protein product [Protopolystoma xenopodis]
MKLLNAYHFNLPPSGVNTLSNLTFIQLIWRRNGTLSDEQIAKLVFTVNLQLTISRPPYLVSETINGTSRLRLANLLTSIVDPAYLEGVTRVRVNVNMWPNATR